MSDDVVNHPQHYTAHPSGIECITVTRHMNFNLGNATKYIWRAGLKGDAVEDLRKAAFYIADEIARLEAHREEMRAELVRGIEADHAPADLARGEVLQAILTDAVTVGIDPQYGAFTVHDPDGSSHPAPAVERWHE